MIVTIQGTGIDLTEAIKRTVEEKIGGLDKYFDGITKIEVDVGRRSNHHQKGDVYYAEALIHVPNDQIFVTKEEEDLYKAINKVKDHCKYLLDEYKEKLRSVDKSQIRDQRAYALDSTEE